MKKNLILVIGRSGSGKDTLVRYAANMLKDFHKSATYNYTMMTLFVWCVCKGLN